MLEFMRAGAVAAMLATSPDAGTMPSPLSIRGPATAAAVQVADPWLGADKFQHFWMSYAVTAFVFAGTRMAGAETDAALHIAVPAATLVGVAKEVHDRRSGGRFSVRDLVADGLGVAAAFFLLREVR
ncbi:MAG TPA: DUF2279 domain-containing protein [Longimicrobiales bacterium]|nr:DUF2279 domain-containing protein [Longimicrobiales bacterium]